ncbi:MAG: hypothetical protein Q9215_000123 [Flavoplaca cf. flavocitrina]
MIQAKSLSNVIRLADDPPALPYSDQEALDPLILYIARIPGNRGITIQLHQSTIQLGKLTCRADVLLTTTKPLQKVVTAQDVRSSLYYIHVDSQDDERIRESMESCNPDPDQSSTAHRTSTHPRTGLAMEGSLPTDPTGMKSHPRPSQSAFDDLQLPLPDSSRLTAILRKPVNQSSRHDSQAAQTSFKPSKAHIIGPRAMHPRLHSVDSPALRPAHGKENLMPRRWSEQPPPVTSSAPLKTAVERYPAASPQASISSHGQMPGSQNVDQGSSPERVLMDQLGGETPSLTLIRRYDGSQWNVGKILNACQPEKSIDNLAPYQPDHIAIQINTPGYSKYHFPGIEASFATAHVFERRLLKTRRRSEGRTLFENSPSTANQRTSRMSIDFRKWSKPHVENPHNLDERSNPSPERKSTDIKGYSFYSPWNGTCEFSTGVTGQSLKCKHTAPEQGSQAKPVSELRFNLPTSGSLGTASPTVLRSPGRLQNSKNNSYISNKPGSESIYSEASDKIRTNDKDEDEHFDLSLGQEHAGGGFGGKQAKLGKLIVEPEGLKMLDLVVAANMGLWWKVYDRSA